MFKYKNQYLTEAMTAELDELMNNGHAEAITAFAKEIQNASLEGYYEGIANGAIKVFVKGTLAGAIATGLGFIVVDIGTTVYKELKARKRAKKEIADMIDNFGKV